MPPNSLGGILIYAKTLTTVHSFAKEQDRLKLV
jgi:hypothetical protein